MKLYDLLDSLEPFKPVRIHSVNMNYYKFDWIAIYKGCSWNNKYGWTFCVSSPLDVHVPHTPQDRSRHSLTNTSGEAYTIVYKRWKCLIKRIKEEYENVEVELEEL